MNKVNLNKVIKDGNIVIPIYILKCYKDLNLKMEEFIFLMYLHNKQENVVFNPERIADDLGIDIMEVMGYISVLSDKEYLSLDVYKDENNIIEEVVNLTNFYEKISTVLINSGEMEEKKENILLFIEKELGRPLNSMEIKTITGWQENKIDETLIKEAVKIAIGDGVYSLKYIDKVLFDWSSRGFKTIDDLKKQEDNYNQTNENNDDVSFSVVEDWNWLDDEEEYIIN